MKIAIVGLGLIGGSLCKTIKKRTPYTVLGIDTDLDTVQQALNSRAIDRAIGPQELSQADLTFLCLYPAQTVEFVRQNAGFFRKESIVADTCGVKQPVVSRHGVLFVGAHPMAGREYSGFAHATGTLFDHASFLIAKTPRTNAEAVYRLACFARTIGFQEVVFTTPQRHDQIIAFTSQLAHVVSNAYMKSPTAQYERGFTGGSFQDLTRVAMLNDQMWSELFLCNKEPLLAEIDTLLLHLNQVRAALAAENRSLLRQLLYQGSELKKRDLQNNPR